VRFLHALLGVDSAPRFDRLGLAPHQREGALRVLYTLQRRGGVILADEPGLGKSYVALAVAVEYESAGSSTLIVCPAGLTGQWRRLLDRFAVSAQVCSQESPDLQRGRAVDLLIVDEAHHFRNPSTDRFRDLAPSTTGARILLITATPLCNSRRDVLELLKWIVPDDALRDRGVDSIAVAFDQGDPEAIAAISDELIIRRTRDVLPEALRAGSLTRRVVWHSADDFSVEAALNALAFPGMERHTSLLRRHLRRRLESSHAALRDTLRRQKRFYARVEGMRARGLTLTKRDWLRSFRGQEDGCEQEPLFPEAFASLSGSFDAGADHIAAELVAIDRVLETLTRDWKRETLDNLLESEPVQPTLIFTGSVVTAADLHRLLRARHEVALLTSRFSAWGSRRVSRDAAMSAFMSGRIELLISTDLASEGLNLERGSRVIHYDLPWTPSRIDQRNGRIWRIGQEKAAIEAIYFLSARHRATRILSILSRKSRQHRLIVDSRNESEVVPMHCATAEDPGDYRIAWRPSPTRAAFVLVRLDPLDCLQLLILNRERLDWSWELFRQLVPGLGEGEWREVQSGKLEELVAEYRLFCESGRLLPPRLPGPVRKDLPRPLRMGATLLATKGVADVASLVNREARSTRPQRIESVTVEGALLLGHGWLECRSEDDGE